MCRRNVLDRVRQCGKSLKRGDAALALGEYAEAAEHYKRAYARTPARERLKRGTVAYKLGDAYRRFGNAARAVGAFRNAERYERTDSFTYLRLGDAQRIMGDYKGPKKVTWHISNSTRATLPHCSA